MYIYLYIYTSAEGLATTVNLAASRVSSAISASSVDTISLSAESFKDDDLVAASGSIDISITSDISAGLAEQPGQRLFLLLGGIVRLAAKVGPLRHDAAWRCPNGGVVVLDQCHVRPIWRIGHPWARQRFRKWRRRLC